MKAILEFDLNDPDERREHSMAVNGRNAYMVLSDIENIFRNILKYDKGVEVGERIRLISGHFHEISNDDYNLLRAVIMEISITVSEAIDDRCISLDDLY